MAKKTAKRTLKKSTGGLSKERREAYHRANTPGCAVIKKANANSK